jgi:hypothetical protein
VRRSARFGIGLVVLATLVLGCDAGKAPVAVQEPEQKSASPELSPRSSRPAAERVVAIGDLHGDLSAAKRALRAAGAIDDKDAWIGGKLVVVQTGDQIDRADDDRQVIDLFEKLKSDAKAAGGEVIALSGNHEIMNASFDFRYVTEGGFAAFEGFTPVGPEASRAARFGATKIGRASAFAPGGVYATILADRPLVMRVGDSVFVHGGVHSKHVTYGIDRINDGVREWLAGRASAPPPIAVADDGPIWTRKYSETATVGPADCASLGDVLAKLHAARMVMGHSVQATGITSACDGKAWRIDVGMSHAYGGPVQVLELRGSATHVITAP